jgi:hypothetical protein
MLNDGDLERRNFFKRHPKYTRNLAENYVRENYDFDEDIIFFYDIENEKVLETKDRENYDLNIMMEKYDFLK